MCVLVGIMVTRSISGGIHMLGVAILERGEEGLEGCMRIVNSSDNVFDGFHTTIKTMLGGKQCYEFRIGMYLLAG